MDVTPLRRDALPPSASASSPHRSDADTGHLAGCLRRSGANVVSATRPPLMWALFADAATIHSDALLVPGVLAIGVAWVVGLDAVDGLVARRFRTTSPFGAFVDVLADRLSNYAALLFISDFSNALRALVVVIVARDLVVDAIKAMSAGLGNRLTDGILVAGRLRSALVLSRTSRVLYRVVAALTFVSGVLLGTYVRFPIGVTLALLGVMTLLCLVRGAGSVIEAPRTIRRGAVGPPDALSAGFGLQSLIAGAVLGLLCAGVRVFHG
jgi:phosphatidylglycerophosphate synthase